MALDKNKLQNDIKAILTELMASENSGIDAFASRIATAVDDYVKGAKINYINGLNAGTNPVTGIFNGNLS